MIKSELSTELCKFLTGMEKELKSANEVSIQRRFVTSTVIRITLVIMFLLAIANVYFLNMLSKGLTNTISNADIIDEKFSDVANDMTAITSSVENINVEVSTLTPIAKNVSYLNNNMNLINQDLHHIAATMSGIENSIYQVDESMSHVDHTMKGISKDMYFIGDDVNKMSLPVKWMNKIVPW